MSSRSILIGLDVGEKRIGVSVADSGVRIAIPLTTVVVDGTEVTAIAKLIDQEGADTLVVGYPRNQSGEPTTQTEYVEKFAAQLEPLVPKLAYQDESLTSVIAEQRLKVMGGTYQKSDIDAQAATIILQDYVEVHYG